MNIHVRTRRNSRIVTQSLLNMSEQTPTPTGSLQLVGQNQFPSSTQPVSNLTEIKNNEFFRSTTLSFKTYSTVRKQSAQLKKRDFMEDFLKKREISLTKVTLRYNRFNLALNDMSQTYNQTCFMSKKLKAKSNHSRSQRKSSLSQSRISVNPKKQATSKNWFSQRICINPQEQKYKKLHSMNQIKKRYTLFGNCNRTII